MSINREIKPGLGARLKKAREAAGLTQRELNEAAGSKGAVSVYRIEAGITKSPGIDELAKMAEALGRSVDYLITGVEEGGAQQSVVDADDVLPSLVEWLASHREDLVLVDEEELHLHSHAFKGWDPGPDYWTNALIAYRRAKRLAKLDDKRDDLGEDRADVLPAKPKPKKPKR